LRSDLTVVIIWITLIVVTPYASILFRHIVDKKIRTDRCTDSIEFLLTGAPISLLKRWENEQEKAIKA